MRDDGLAMDAICDIREYFGKRFFVFSFVRVDAVHFDVFGVVMIAGWADQSVVAVDNLVFLNDDNSHGTSTVPGIGSCFKIDGGEIHDVTISDSVRAGLFLIQQVRGVQPFV